MNKLMLALLSGGVVFAAGLNTAVAQDDNSASAVEMFACSYAEGMGPDDLDAVVEKWNEWADDQGYTDYTAWTLTPFYAGPEQDFDYIWLGVTETGKGMGEVQDKWIANGGSVGDEFDRVSPCNAHTMSAAVQFKEPPERDDPSRIILDFSNCTIGDGWRFGSDVAPALRAWGESLTESGSTAGAWALFPVYGGGGENFDFKYVESFGSYAEQGTDFDNYDPDKARAIFPHGLLSCDSSRSYVGTKRRTAESDDD